MTVKALGRDMSSSHEYINSRYLKLASRFNDEMMSLPHTWDDRLLGLVKRPLLVLQAEQGHRRAAGLAVPFPVGFGK